MNISEPSTPPLSHMLVRHRLSHGWVRGLGIPGFLNVVLPGGNGKPGAGEATIIVLSDGEEFGEDALRATTQAVFERRTAVIVNHCREDAFATFTAIDTASQGVA